MSEQQLQRWRDEIAAKAKATRNRRGKRQPQIDRPVGYRPPDCLCAHPRHEGTCPHAGCGCTAYRRKGRAS